jgi:hypothetical protein
MTAEEQWQHMWELQQLPRTPGVANAAMRYGPMTPRTTAFADLEGGAHRAKSGGWYGAGAGAAEGSEGGGVGIGVQHAVSPVQEGDEFAYYSPHDDGKGKGTAY